MATFDMSDPTTLAFAARPDAELRKIYHWDEADIRSLRKAQRGAPPDNVTESDQVAAYEAVMATALLRNLPVPSAPESLRGKVEAKPAARAKAEAAPAEPTK